MFFFPLVLGNIKKTQLGRRFPKRKQSCLPHMSLDGKNCVFFFTGRWDHKLKLSQKVIDTPSGATWLRGLIC